MMALTVLAIGRKFTRLFGASKRSAMNRHPELVQI